MCPCVTPVVRGESSFKGLHQCVYMLSIKYQTHVCAVKPITVTIKSSLVVVKLLLLS